MCRSVQVSQRGTQVFRRNSAIPDPIVPTLPGKNLSGRACNGISEHVRSRHGEKREAVRQSGSTFAWQAAFRKEATPGDVTGVNVFAVAFGHELPNGGTKAIGADDKVKRCGSPIAEV